MARYRPPPPPYQRRPFFFIFILFSIFFSSAIGKQMTSRLTFLFLRRFRLFVFFSASSCRCYRVLFSMMPPFCVFISYEKSQKINQLNRLCWSVCFFLPLSVSEFYDGRGRRREKENPVKSNAIESNRMR